MNWNDKANLDELFIRTEIVSKERKELEKFFIEIAAEKKKKITLNSLDYIMRDMVTASLQMEIDRLKTQVEDLKYIVEKYITK